MGIGDASVWLLERANAAHVIVAEHKIEYVEVLCDTRRIRRARDRGNDSLLHQPAQCDLRESLAGALRDLAKNRIVGEAAARQRTIGGEHQATFVARGDHFALVKIRMALGL